MIRILTLLILFNPFCFSAYSQEFRISEDSLLLENLDKISKSELRKNLSVLASDSLMGRETGKAGQKMAANYLVENLRHYGISGAGDSLGYYQRFELYKPRYENIYQVLKGDTLRSWEDFYTFSTANDTVYYGEELIFLGYGIDSDEYSDYKENTSYNGLGVIFTGEPYHDGKFLISDSKTPSEWSENIQLKVDVAQNKGLSGLIIINEQFDQLLPRVIYYQNSGRPRLERFENSKFPVLVMGTERFNSLFPKLKFQKTINRLNEQKKLKNTSLSQNWSIHYDTREEKLFSENVMGIIRGKELPDEYVFMTAHYDHLGKQGEEIYNGADDDGSGTTSLLEIARIFSEVSEKLADFPKRSVVFMWVSGEEKGLLGSKYYTENPIYPLEETVVDLNIDMVGRRDTLHTANDSSYIYLIGSDKLSSDLHSLSEQVNEIYSNYDLDYTYNDDQHPSRLYYRSDHYNFAKHNIPVIFYFGGMHDDYHKPTDEVNKIDFDILSGVTRLVMATSWHIANAEKRIEVDNPVKLVR